MSGFKFPLLISALLTATTASAGNTHYYSYGKVMQVTPVYEYTQVSHPKKVCRTKHKARTHHKHNAAGTVTGAIVGGAIGHAIGHNKSNKKVGLIAGAALGGAIAHELTHSSHTQYHPVTRCHKVSYSVSKQRQLRGYEVTYRYKGRTLHTFSHQHPGDRIQLRVNVQPVL